MDAAEQLAIKAGEFRAGESVICQYFYRCENRASHILDMGPLGAVPVCKSCKTFYERES